MRKWAGEEGDDFYRDKTQLACFSEKFLHAKANGDLDKGGNVKIGVRASEKIGAFGPIAWTFSKRKGFSRKALEIC